MNASLMTPSATVGSTRRTFSSYLDDPVTVAHLNFGVTSKYFLVGMQATDFRDREAVCALDVLKAVVPRMSQSARTHRVPVESWGCSSSLSSKIRGNTWTRVPVVILNSSRS